MKSSLSLRRVFSCAVDSIRENAQIYSCLMLIFALGNYIFLRLEKDNPLVFLLHIIGIYVFYYAFVRIHFKKRPIFEMYNFFHSAGKALIILLLSFASVMFLRIGFELLKLFAKSFAVFPEIYGFLSDTYYAVKDWQYTGILLYMFLFAILMFVFFIPFFAWISSVTDKEQSIIFSVLETKDSYTKLFFMYFMLYGILPIILTGIMIAYKVPLIFMCLVSSCYSVIQISVYIQTYLALFDAENKE